MRDTLANMQSKGMILIDCSLFIWNPWVPFYLFASMEPGTREPINLRGGFEILHIHLSILASKQTYIKPIFPNGG
jgi:hypothetical protein